MNQSSMNEVTKGFIELIVATGVLKFGKFKTKSGRETPLFYQHG